MTGESAYWLLRAYDRGIHDGVMGCPESPPGGGKTPAASEEVAMYLRGFARGRELVGRMRDLLDGLGVLYRGA